MIAECADRLVHLGEKLFNETEMKYRAGNKVRIKSLDWYNENKGMNGLVGLFTPCMKKLCGKVVTLDSAYNGKYTAIEEDAKGYYLDDSMIEGLAEGLTDEEFMEEWTKVDINKLFNDAMAKNMKKGCNEEFSCPEGYEFKDENGNVIEAKKIVLEKKKPKYPKSYEECLKILNIPYAAMYIQQPPRFNYKLELLLDLQQLLICRDAYLEIAGKDLGLNKRWEPSYANGFCSYAIIRHTGHIRKSRPCANSVLLEFPTEEMRDAFYENFKDLIEECKELL